MHRETAHTRRRSRSLAVLLLALAIIAVFGIAAQQALAIGSYEHFTATSCSNCHTGSPSGSSVTSARCITCHTGYTAIAGKTCWTCHTPGQAMASVKAGAPANCTTVCHLANGTDSTHVAHPDRSATCTTCHPLTVSGTNANGSWHHTVQASAPFVTAVSLKVGPTVITLKKTVKATGKVTPVAGLAGAKVALKAQIKKGTKWVTAKTSSRTVSATGTYAWTYKPLKKGSYRIKASIAATATYKASKSAFRTFRVK